MKIINYLFISCFILVGFACGSTNSTSSEKTIPDGSAGDAASQVFQKLNAGDFQAKMDELNDYQLVDVRTIEELQETGTIANAQHIDYHSDNFAALMEALDKDKPVMVYCKSGGRSGNACEVLKKLNFKEVYDLDGGITAWQSENRPTESIEGTDKK